MHIDYIQALSHSGPLTIRVNGDCMGIELPDGCRVTINRKLLYWPGDIVVIARGDDQLVSHRFLGYFHSLRVLKAITMADNEGCPDAPVPVARIIGKAVLIDGESIAYPPLRRLAAIGMFLRVLPRVIQMHFRQGK